MKHTVPLQQFHFQIPRREFKLSFLFPFNRLSGQDFVALQRLMKEQIEDVQVNQSPDDVPELLELQNPS